jgi:hypothetical protein
LDIKSYWFKTARYGLAGTGTQTAALGFGGDIPPITGATEEYNGTSWTSSKFMNTARTYLTGAGTQTAALAFGGTLPPFTGATEEYDGTSWTTVNSLNTARNTLGGAGTTSAALGFGGNDSAPGYLIATEEWTGAGAPVTKTITVS